jgi:hypothetical protein
MLKRKKFAAGFASVVSWPPEVPFTKVTPGCDLA